MNGRSRRDVEYLISEIGQQFEAENREINSQILREKSELRKMMRDGGK